MRYLSLLHSRVLQAGGVTIPTPVSAGRVLCAEGLEELSGTATALATTNSSGVSATEGANDSGVRRALREKLQHLRSDMCRIRDEVEDANRLFAFSPSDVRSILECAISTPERLVVSLAWFFLLCLLSVCLSLSLSLIPPKVM